MLKPGEHMQEPPPERPIGDLVHQLIDEGKTYARAEADVLKAMATGKARAVVVPFGLLAIAFLLAQAAVTVLAVAAFAVLQWVLGTILAGLLAFLIFLGLAGGLAWYGAQRLKRVL